MYNTASESEIRTNSISSLYLNKEMKLNLSLARKKTTEIIAFCMPESKLPPLNPRLLALSCFVVVRTIACDPLSKNAFASASCIVAFAVLQFASPIHYDASPLAINLVM